MLLVKIKSGSTEIVIEQPTFSGACSPLATNANYDSKANNEVFLESMRELCKQVQMLEHGDLTTHKE